MIVLNNCPIEAPHPAHSWDGVVTKYQCMGLGMPNSMPAPGHMPLMVDPSLIDMGATAIDPGRCIRDYIASQPSFVPFAVDNEDVPEEPEVSDAEGRIALELTAAWEKFLEGYREYGEGAADELGLAGQWGDLYRKIKKLKRPLWEGDREALTRESPRQVLQDIIGHALLALDMLERGM